VSFEAGTNFHSRDGRMTGKLNLYRTTWRDRTVTRPVTLASGEVGLANLLGLDALHQGIELELAYQPMDLLRFDAAASFGDWTYTNAASGTYRPEDDPSAIEEWTFYVKDLKVGDAPQTQFAYSASVFPI